MEQCLIFATKNEGKMKEIREILSDVPYKVQSMSEAGIDIDVIEDGDTFEANALKKATEICQVSKCIVLADDSGLEIDFFDKAPGVYSARYLGKDTPYSEKNAIILDRMKEVPRHERTARFVCAIAVAFPDGTTHVVRETIEGEIGYESKGDNGFGYDPIFFVPEHKMTTSQMPSELKNQLSHRGKALRKMKALYFNA
ncbi:XTP/dITP diphosphatase [Vallitaleaceae bacterium 9-2]